MNPLRQVTVLAGVFFFVGMGFVSVGAFQYFEICAFVRTSETAEGRVVDLEYRSRSGGRFRGGYVTVFTFLDASAQAHTVRTSSVRKPATHDVGDKVVVLYQPGAPESARIRAFRTLWMVPAIFVSFGLALSSMGTFAFMTARRIYGSTQDEDAAY